MDTRYGYNIGYRIREINLSHIVCQSTWFLKITRREEGEGNKNLKNFGLVRPKT